MVKTFKINAAPISWKRVGFTLRHSGLHVYDQQAHERNIYSICIASQFGNSPPFPKKPLSFDASFFFETPKKYHQLARYSMAANDIDNLCKWCLDCAQKAKVIANDNLICQLTARKLIADTPHVIFTISDEL
jgi:Holliday junction resolvase RusA-like endonuclease